MVLKRIVTLRRVAFGLLGRVQSSVRSLVTLSLSKGDVHYRAPLRMQAQLGVRWVVGLNFIVSDFEEPGT